MPVPTDRQILDSLRTALHELLVDGVAASSVTWGDGRATTFTDPEKLERLIERYEARVARNESPGMVQVPVRFRP